MRVLLVEDDKNLADVVADHLKKEGYLADWCPDGEQALSFALHGEFSYDVILLDRMLPIIDGLTVLKAIRQKQLWTPVLMITGLSQLEDKVDGLDCGADDYLVKPFHMKELSARIRALIRRPADMTAIFELSAFGLTLDTERRRLSCKSRAVLLTGKESELLQVFMKEPERVHSRDELLWKVWGGFSEVEAGNVDSYIHFLRKRLQSLDCKVKIRTVYGVGYRLEETP